MSKMEPFGLRAAGEPAELGCFISGDGGASRDRTGDLKLAKLALSQLSYGPNSNRGCSWWAEKELNLRPHAYQACALTT
jgi:hypothetical protein